MDGIKFKIIGSQQAKLNNYTKTKLKLLQTNAAIWYNKICKTKAYIILVNCTYFQINSAGYKKQDP
jgi:hypothetical protein